MKSKFYVILFLVSTSSAFSNPMKIGASDKFDIELPDKEQPSDYETFLSKTLSFETGLSKHSNQPWATYRNSHLGFRDGGFFGLEIDSKKTCLQYNVTSGTGLNRGDRFARLKEQVLRIIQEEIENSISMDEGVKRLKKVDWYNNQLEKDYSARAFNDSHRAWTKAGIERTILPDNAPFDWNGKRKITGYVSRCQTWHVAIRICLKNTNRKRERQSNNFAAAVMAI